MAKIELTLVFPLVLVVILSFLFINQTIQAQTEVNFTKLFQEKYTFVYPNTDSLSKYLGYNFTSYQNVIVRYESPTTILISGDLITPHVNTFNSLLWQAMDMLRGEYGFKLQQVMTSGVGSEGNPTVVYILMSK